MSVDVSHYRRVAEQMAGKPGAINNSAAACLMLQLCSLFEERWISVEDRLPQDGERVIACFPEETESVGEATFRLTEDNQWLTEHGSWFLVTHWIPLPSPPEVK